ncbi:hypothetical protein GOP47_0017712 [Adiantum capillus-veneris]|uniref:Uncharacterized protein n=1 Tax=Adiantum capillus-veneris TaxID=13818 RepID=A0A9D4UGV9_ADICA|nr:hypothetical protein GOP47_0017712 [Adiantum capillus-veneris]
MCPASNTTRPTEQQALQPKQHYRSLPSSDRHRQSYCYHPEDDEQSPLFLAFNQDITRLSCGTQKGFRVYNLVPPSLQENTNWEPVLNGGIATVELMYDRGFAAIVGGGENPKFPPNKVMMWDFLQRRCRGELSFRSPVRAVKLRLDKLVVVLEHKIFVYEFETLNLIFDAETLSNPKGLCAISGAPASPFVFACPGLQKGEVRIEWLRPMPDKKLSRETNMIAAHDSHLACIALSFDGRLLATASNKGTLIRVFSTFDGTHLQELRRGAERAEIYSLTFSATAHWLAVSSDKGTVHVFGISPSYSRHSKSVVSGPGSANPGSSLSFLRGVLPRYFSSEWSFAQFRLPEEIKSIVAFAPEKHILYIVGSNGSFYKCTFDPVHGGEMEQKEYVKFLKLKNDMY